MRMQSSSGGLATWFLRCLLRNGEIDKVITVAPKNDAERLFEYREFSSDTDLEDAAGSAYYPVECSGVLSGLRERPGRYAIVGLPCVLHAVERARHVDRRLRERIVCLVGLVCGQNKSAMATRWFCHQAGLPGRAVRVVYRDKTMAATAQGYSMVARDAGGNEVTWRRGDGYASAWHRGWFTLPACSVCDDVFAECADIVFMDAWLPRYVSDARGTNLVLVREPRFVGMFEDANGTELDMEPVTIQDLVDSQRHVVRDKTLAVRERVRQLLRGGVSRTGVPSPARRRRGVLWPVERRMVRLRFRVTRAVRDATRERPGDRAHVERRVAHFEKHLNLLVPLRGIEQRCQALFWSVLRRLQVALNSSRTRGRNQE